ncbi:hypothetical protein SNK04_014096 [Fusarium graminearum]
MTRRCCPPCREDKRPLPVLALDDRRSSPEQRNPLIVALLDLRVFSVPDEDHGLVAAPVVLPSEGHNFTHSHGRIDSERDQVAHRDRPEVELRSWPAPPTPFRRPAVSLLRLGDGARSA